MHLKGTKIEMHSSASFSSPPPGLQHEGVLIMQRLQQRARSLAVSLSSGGSVSLYEYVFDRASVRKILSDGRLGVGRDESTESGRGFRASDWLKWSQFQSF